MIAEANDHNQGDYGNVFLMFIVYGLFGSLEREESRVE